MAGKTKAPDDDTTCGTAPTPDGDDEAERSYYYDDAHGYQEFDPDEDDDGDGE